MEAFIVEANSAFERSLGNKLGAAYTRNGVRVGGTLEVVQLVQQVVLVQH